MPKRNDISSVLLIGSGPIVIGQACEFDYSGTQAVKALKEEAYKVILVNSNPATVMTDQNLADKTYIEPITAEFIARIIEKERPDALLPTIGGQTGLNVTLELAEQGVLEKFNVELIGANIKAIQAAEDREKFKDVVSRIGLESAKSELVTTEDEAIAAAKIIGFPLIIRPSRTLGGSGGAIVKDESEFLSKVHWGFECSPIHALLLEESLIGWKEIELEVMRDRKDNAVIVCGIENIDPMGLHTGDSATVAPIQTLTDKEYQELRDSALLLMKEIGVDTGGSNVQFAICPKTGRQIVIEMNPRVSRSSALASKATGFPIAKLAAKLAIGYTLDELPNDITKKTPASFEPSIDYVVVKMPRFTFEKFPDADAALGTQMKSVGEAMAIGRTFAEALQKACRSLETGRIGLLGGKEESITDISVLKRQISELNPDRLFQTARCLELGVSIEELSERTAYDPWFLQEMLKIVQCEKEIKACASSNIDSGLLLSAKKLGLSDIRIAKLLNKEEDDIRLLRHKKGIYPSYKTVDTCAAEFASETPYLYSTYEDTSDSLVSNRKKIVILGGGPNRIGQGLEFDYCCVHAAFSLSEAGYETIMVNCNPETVSTDYDTSDCLYFEPLTLEDVLEIVHHEKPNGVIVHYGGQTPLKLAKLLKENGVPIIGTTPESIEITEDREKFSVLLEQTGLRQSEGGTASCPEEAHKVASRIGFPLLVRPSFVLGGRAMAIIHNHSDLDTYIRESVSVSFERPVLLDRFLNNAIEIDVDAVCDGEKALVAGIMEHVELAGIHSGDSCFILPTQTISKEVIEEIERSTVSLAHACSVRGLMNIQYAVCNKLLYVIEVNPRASRSVPFVSKVTGIPWAKVAARIMAGESITELHSKAIYGNILKHENYAKAASAIKHVAVKESVFPFVKFRGVDTVLGPEMKSTGEVMGIDSDASISFIRSQIAAGLKLPKKGGVFISVRDEDKQEIVSVAKQLQSLGFKLFATIGTAKSLREAAVSVSSVNKVRDGSPHVIDLLQSNSVSMVINTPEGSSPMLDSRIIRSTATELSLPLFTTIAAAKMIAEGLSKWLTIEAIEVKTIQEYLNQIEA